MVIPFINKINELPQEPSKVSYSCISLNSGLEKANKLNKIDFIEKDRILYFDDDLIFVNKPYNMLTVPGFKDTHSLATIIQKMFKIENIENMSPHRLDLQTPGVVVFTRNMNALRSITEQFKNRDASKKYTAIVKGTLIEEQVKLYKF
jgi:23S rRNA-/tRNA-specific pseudouridylate synthase